MKVLSNSSIEEKERDILRSEMDADPESQASKELISYDWPYRRSNPQKNLQS